MTTRGGNERDGLGRVTHPVEGIPAGGGSATSSPPKDSDARSLAPLSIEAERATYTREHASGHFWRRTKAGDPRTPAANFLEFLQGRSVSQLAVRLADMTGDAPRKWSRKLYRILNCEKQTGTRTVSLADADAICLVLGVPLSEVWVEE